MKCIVKGCQNQNHEGRFIYELCAPCHEMLVTGIIANDSRTFIGKAFKAYREEIIRLNRDQEELRIWQNKGENLINSSCTFSAFHLGLWWAERPWRLIKIKGD
jgi:hypothetical protein